METEWEVSESLQFGAFIGVFALACFKILFLFALNIGQPVTFLCL